MIYTATMTSKGQLTVPLPIRKKLAVNKGSKFDVHLVPNGGFLAQPRRKSQIMKYAGKLAHKDDGRPLSEIRRIAGERNARELVKKWGWLR